MPVAPLFIIWFSKFNLSLKLESKLYNIICAFQFCEFAKIAKFAKFSWFTVAQQHLSIKCLMGEMLLKRFLPFKVISLMSFKDIIIMTLFILDSQIGTDSKIWRTNYDVLNMKYMYKNAKKQGTMLYPHITIHLSFKQHTWASSVWLVKLVMGQILILILVGQ